MTIYQAVILGIVQGVTEFFPISSSGHLVIAQGLFGFKGPQLAFDILLHLGTLVAIVIFFWKDILGLFGKDRRLLYLLVLSSIPTFIIGLCFKDVVENFFGMPRIAGYMLVVTGLWLGSAAVYSAKKKAPRGLGAANSIMIGIAQGIAVMPGISRSGATIATGILAGLDRELSFKFSFLLAIPAILGASAVKAHKIGAGLAAKDAVLFLAGAAAAMAAGLFTLKVLENLIKGNRLYLFSIYCVLAGLAVVIFYR